MKIQILASDVYQIKRRLRKPYSQQFYGLRRPCSRDPSFLSGVPWGDSISPGSFLRARGSHFFRLCAHRSSQSFSGDSKVEELSRWTGIRMASEARYCRECRTVTQHVVVSGKDVMAQLCQECLWRWATELDSTEKPVSGQLALRPGRRIQNANPERRSETKDKDHRL
jgi:hypothetical protein